MEAPKKLTTWNIKKCQRFETKKRKIEALLNLFENDNTYEPRTKRKPETLSESYKALKDELKQYIKKPQVDPSFYLNQRGLKAKYDCSGSPVLNLEQVLEPLFTEDLYNLLLRSAIGHNSLYKCTWGTLENPQHVCRTVVLVVEGFAKHDIADNISHFNDAMNIFPNVVEVLSPNIPFATELSTLHSVTSFHIQSTDTFSSMFPKNKEVKLSAAPHENAPSKLHLLLSPIQLVMENYPLPQSVFQYSKSENYVFSKELYSPVTKDSPLFAIDCEMCRTENGRNELTRVAVVNENLQVIYHSLVKPEKRIVDYMTKYSGITKEMLVNVTVSLKDVQKHIQAILPPDAILCGQSLNFDLHALQMIHPYVIDTSIIFNLSGIRGKKDSLKRLSLNHLNEVIQNNKLGHHPVEDAIASMKLVLLKLDNSIQYGDACLENSSLSKEVDNNNSSNKEVDNNNSSNIEVDNNNSSNKEVQNNESDLLDKSSSSYQNPKAWVSDDGADGFFSRLSKFSKTACLVGTKESLEKYVPSMLRDNVHKRTKPNINKIKKATLKYMNNFDLTISTFKFQSPSGETVAELNNIVKEIYDCCVDKTMFMVLVSGIDNTKFHDVKSGLCFPVLKRIK